MLLSYSSCQHGQEHLGPDAVPSMGPFPARLTRNESLNYQSGPALRTNVSD